MSNNHSYCHILLASLAILGGGLLTGCQEETLTGDDTVPSVELSVVSTDAGTAEVSLKTTAIAEYAYAVYSAEPETEITEDVLFMSGTSGECSDGENTFTVSGLEPLTDYTIYLAATTVSDEYYGEVLTARFTTTDYSEDITLVETFYDGFSVHIKMPESVTEAGHVLRYTFGNLFMYNYNKLGWSASSDASMLEANGGQYTESSVTVTYNDDNVSYIDADGTEVVLHDPIAPGEPVMFFVGEFGEGESMYGWGTGWYDAMFDEAAYQEALWSGSGDIDEADYWTGYYNRMSLRAREPEVLDATVDVDMDIQAVTGTIKFTPDPEVYQYCVLAMDQTSYDMVLQYLDGNEDYLQWFSTSYYAAMMLGMRTFMGNTEMSLSDYLFLQEQSHYHLLVTAMGDVNGTSQSFRHLEFDTTGKQLDPPVVTVTAYDDDNPYEVRFNIKNTGSEDIVSGMYAANYERDWAGVLDYMTYADVAASGNPFTAEEVAQINTEEGLDVTFTTIDGMTTRLAVLVYNSEQTANDLNSEGSPAVADATSPYQPDAARVESPLFSSLEGEWTMTAAVSAFDYNEGGYVDQGEKSVKVTVYDGIEDYPETLPDEVYGYYTPMTAEEVDALYDEFKKEAEAFNARVRGQNRLLCLGFGYEAADMPGSFAVTTPYELFCNPDYSSYDVASLFYDFGPKWYLQVNEDGTVTVPVNSSLMYPLSAWTDNVYYLAGYEDSGYISVGEDNATVTFPVEVASDASSFTVAPMELDGVEFFPNVVYIYYGTYASLGGNRIDSPLTLTRGWSPESASSQSVPGPSVKNTLKLYPVNGVSSASVQRPKSRTPFRALKPYTRVDDFRIVPADEFERNLMEYNRQIQSR